MILQGIVVNYGLGEQRCYDPKYKSFNAIRNDASLQKDGVKVATVFKTGINAHLVLDFKKILPTLVEDEIATWDEYHLYIERRDQTWIATYKTSVSVPQYIELSETDRMPCPFGGLTNNQLTIASFENGTWGTIELGDMYAPYVRDNTSTNGDDVVFTNIRGLDIDNCIPVVNGCMFKPEPWTNVSNGKKEIFARSAGRLVRYAKWNQKRTHTAPHWAIPDSSDPYTSTLGSPYAGYEMPVPRAYCYNVGPMLIDFSNVGTIEIVDYKECKNYSFKKISSETVEVPKTSRENEGTDEFVFHPHNWLCGDVVKKTTTSYQLSFLLPDTIASGCPIVSLFGKPFFFKDQVTYEQTSDGMLIILTITHDLMERFIMSNMQQYGRHIEDTSMVQTITDLTLKHLFDSTPIGRGTEEDLERLAYEDYLKPFVIVIHPTKEIDVVKTRPKMVISPDKLVFPVGTGGLLVNRSTLEIIDYVRSNFKNDMLVTYTLQCPLNIVKDCDPYRMRHPQLGYERYDCATESEFLKMSEFTKDLRSPDNFELIDINFSEPDR